MTIDYNKTAEDLTAGLSRLQTEFEKLQSGQTKSQLEAQGDLSNKTSTALDRLLDLTKILDGDFNAAPPPSTVAAALTDLDSSWQAAEKAAENCLTLMNSYSVLVSVSFFVYCYFPLQNATLLTICNPRSSSSMMRSWVDGKRTRPKWMLPSMPSSIAPKKHCSISRMLCK